MDAEVLEQIIWIKWLLAAMLLSFIAICALLIWFMVFFAKMQEHMKTKVSFSENAKSLLDQGKPEELLSLSEARIAMFPEDAEAHWFLAQACYRIGDLGRSLISLRKTQELQPEWENSYTGPFIRVIEERIADGKSK